MKKMCVILALVMALVCVAPSALACTTIYVGSSLTEDGMTYFGRSEDYSNSYNKLFGVAGAGAHAAGEVYHGCYGFTWTFTHDSYSYTAFCDDNQAGQEYYCPDCGSDHFHTPYQAAGTNEMGVTITATETLGCTDAAAEADPFNYETGIEEAEIPTIILSEAASAKEGVELLLSIYDSVGCQGGSGIIIADDKEAWYIENVTGTQYIALKLNDELVFAEPNMSIIGLIDLDDTENVIASAALIETAEKAGSYVGDKEANTIDFVQSFNGDQTANSRMEAILPYFSENNTKESYDFADYCISNVDAEGNIVPVYTNITLDKAYTIQDVVEFYHIPVVGTGRSTETHIFAISSEDSLTDTVEWVAVNDPTVNPFIPYYPMLTTEVYSAYGTSTVSSEKVEEEPTEGLYYPTSIRHWSENGPVYTEAFCVLPENWADGYYWTVDVISHFITEEDTMAATQLSALQQACYAGYENLVSAVAAAEDPAQAATQASMNMAETAHTVMVGLATEIIK